MERHTRTAGLARRPLALLMAGIIALAGMAVTTAPADANPTPPIEVTLDVRGCPERGDIPAHVYVWPSATASGTITDFDVAMRFRLAGGTDNDWQPYESVFSQALSMRLLTDIAAVREFEVQYQTKADSNSSWGTWEALPPITFTVPASIDLATRGSGTAGDPYRISTAQHLDEVGCLTRGGQPHFVLENDITLTGPFLPLGSNIRGDMRITFDGRGHAIRGLDIDRPMNTLVGLFTTAINLSVRDLRIIEPKVFGFREVGPLAGVLDGAVVSRLTIEDAEVRFTTIGTNNSIVGGVVGEGDDSLFSDIRWSADIRSVPGPWPFDRARPATAIARVGGFAGEDDERTHLRRASGVVTIDVEADRVRNVAGLFGLPDAQALWSHVTLDATIRIRTADASQIAGIGGEYLDEGTALVDAIVRVDLEIEALENRTFTADEIGGLFGETEEGAVLRVDVGGSILIDATKATDGTIDQVGGMVGLHGSSADYTTIVSESRSDVDVTILAGAADVEEVGALFGAVPSAIGGAEDVLVTGSVVIETDGGTVQLVGGLVGEIGTSSGTRGRLGRVLWRGGLTIDGLSGDALLAEGLTDVGALLGSDREEGAQRSHCVFWDVANGFTDPDTLLPGLPRTAAELVALLDGDCGFTTGFVQDSGAPVAWCLDDEGEPAITALTAECLTNVETVTVTVPGEPTEALRFACAPLEARPGDEVTCFATGVDAGTQLPWSASASPAFATGTATGNTLGGLAFTFLIPTGMTAGPISVQLGTEATAVQIDVLEALPTSGSDEGSATDSGTTDDTVGGPIPTSVPSGEGRGPAALLLAGLLALAGVTGIGGIAAVRHQRAGGPSPTTA